jgi:hypothetical protein
MTPPQALEYAAEYMLRNGLKEAADFLYEAAEGFYK